MAPYCYLFYIKIQFDFDINFLPFSDECENNPGYMQVSCAPACQSCHMLNFELRCPVDPNATVAWKPGDLNKYFEGLTTDPAYQQYQPTIISRPGMLNPKTNSSPWIVVLDNFLTDEECDKMIELGAEQGYQRSLDVGDETFDGSVGLKENERRTSVNAWCLPPCYDHPTTKQVIGKIENVTGISESHSEYLQLLKYEKGQYYESHHDFPPYTLKRPQGPRILTVFLYLNDVEAGGGTRFTDLDLTVMPKKGRALLWPSVLDENPMAIDMRMHHEALAVEKGVKYGANAWVSAVCNIFFKHFSVSTMQMAYHTASCWLHSAVVGHDSCICEISRLHLKSTVPSFFFCSN